MKIRSLQSRIIVFFLLLLLFMQVGQLFILNTVGTANARRTIGDELVTGERIFRRLLEQNNLQLTQGASILSADFAFREALATNDRETVVSALKNHGARINAQVMTLVGLDQNVIADTRPESHIDRKFSLPQLITEAEAHNKAAAMAMVDGHLYQLVVVPVLAPVPIAWVVMGFAVDDRVVKDLQRLTGLQISFLTRKSEQPWKLQASTLSPALQSVLANGFTGAPKGAPYEVAVPESGDEYVTLISEQSAANDETVVAVLQESLQDALAPFARLIRGMALLAVLGIIISVLVSVAIARGIARPVQQLGVFARRIATGDYSAPPVIVRRDEIGDLAAAFEHMIEGITSRENRIMDLAYRDTLTGLPNRALFNDRLQQAINTTRRLHRPLSVLLLDLDQFKYVNDALGHHIGDLLLCEVAKRLQDVVRRQSDTVARLGGDEYAVLLPTDDAEAAKLIAAKILEALDAPMTLEQQIVDTRASIGIATFPEHGEDMMTLMRHADMAMYLAKRSNTGFAVFDQRYDQQNIERLSLMGELRKAVEEDQLVVYYQPKIGLKDTDANHAEALVRWQHPQRGFIPPFEFIPFAEQTGYIKAITLWVLNRSLEQCATWRREGLDISLSINISTRDLTNSELPGRFAEMLETHGCKAEWLTLEITESAIIEDPDHALKNLYQLHALGCQLSIDDYGTGYSSLAYLKRLPVSELKIDKSFVLGMVKDEDDAVIVRSTIDLAHNMGLKVVAEGVETQEILDSLKEMGCDMAQGYLISKPQSTENFGRWMRESPWAAQIVKA